MGTASSVHRSTTIRASSKSLGKNGRHMTMTTLQRHLQSALLKVGALKKSEADSVRAVAELNDDNLKLHRTIDELQRQVDKLRCLAEHHRIVTDIPLGNHELDSLPDAALLPPAAKFLAAAELSKWTTQAKTPGEPRRRLSPIAEVLSRASRDEDVISRGDNSVESRHNPSVVSGLMAVQSHHRIGVSAPRIDIGNECAKDDAAFSEDKDVDTLNRIMGALASNPFTSKLGTRQQAAIARVMFHRDVDDNEVVIQQGEDGDSLFVTGSGQYALSQTGIKKQNTVVIGPNQVIGEMAILYKCKRTATITALEPGRVWCIGLKAFHVVLYKVALEVKTERMAFLGSVPLLNGLATSYKSKLVSVATERTYKAGDMIIDVRSAVTSDLCFNFIISGEVDVLLPHMGGVLKACTLGAGSHFGETALLGTLSANFQALSSTVVLQIDHLSFVELIVPLEALGTELGSLAAKLQNAVPSGASTACAHVELADLSRIALLGVGGFGKVELVRLPDGKMAALKMIAKEHIMANAQQEHVMSEKKVLQTLDSPFCLSLLQTFKDDRYCYLLTEACLGGELWTTLKRHGRMDEKSTKYYTASVVEAIGYLHSHGFVYRDMKPENVLLTTAGHVKLADFGFAKKLAVDEKTWTFCGTPDYMPPEIVLNRGHDFAADLWPIGVLIFELMSGAPPFYSADSMSTYNRIIVGMSEVAFPAFFNEHAVGIIKALCRDIGSERLGNLHNGFAEIWAHPWFRGFDWKALRGGTMVPPVIPVNKIQKYPTTADGALNESRYTAAVVGSCPWDEEF